MKHLFLWVFYLPQLTRPEVKPCCTHTLAEQTSTCPMGLPFPLLPSTALCTPTKYALEGWKTPWSRIWDIQEAAGRRSGRRNPLAQHHVGCCPCCPELTQSYVCLLLSLCASWILTIPLQSHINIIKVQVKQMDPVKNKLPFLP